MRTSCSLVEAPTQEFVTMPPMQRTNATTTRTKPTVAVIIMVVDMIDENVVSGEVSIR